MHIRLSVGHYNEFGNKSLIKSHHMQCAKLAVDRVYVNSHQSMQKPIDKDRLSMKFFFSLNLNVFIVYVYVNLGRSMLFNFVIDLKSIRLQI